VLLGVLYLLLNIPPWPIKYSLDTHTSINVPVRSVPRNGR